MTDREEFDAHAVFCQRCHEGDVCFLGAALLFSEDVPKRRVLKDNDQGKEVSV